MDATDESHCRILGTYYSPPNVSPNNFYKLKKNNNIDEFFDFFWQIFFSLDMIDNDNLHVCRHSVTVVASIKYPPHISQVICLFSVCNFIRRSIIRWILWLDKNRWVKKLFVGRTNRSRTSNWPPRLLVRQIVFH